MSKDAIPPRPQFKAFPDPIKSTNNWIILVFNRYITRFVTSPVQLKHIQTVRLSNVNKLSYTHTHSDRS